MVTSYPGKDMLIDFRMTYTTLFQLTLTITMSTLSASAEKMFLYVLHTLPNRVMHS